MYWSVEYYTTRDGTQPVREWLEGLSDKKLKAKMQSEIMRLERHGIDILINTNSLDRIGGPDKNLFELIGGQGRIIFYCDAQRNGYVLLNAFLKKHQKELRRIEEARRYLHDYLDRKGE